MKVIVTDAGANHALTAIRALGKEGVSVFGASSSRYNRGTLSRYCKGWIKCNAADKNPERFLADIKKEIQRGSYDVVLPISFSSCKVISKHKEELESMVNVPIADYRSMEIASDKNKTIKFVSDLNINTPKTYFPAKISSIKKIAKYVKFPAVIKACEESGSVNYANNETELISKYKKECIRYGNQVNSGLLPIVQEYVKGEARGFFGLFKDGKRLATFAHKRIHEYPITGGPSTMAVSIKDPRLEKIGCKILKKLNWTGVAMVEFKYDPIEKRYVLIEINPKFWGSLALSLACGINFPYLDCKMALGEPITHVNQYKEGLKFRWMFPGEVLFILSSPNKIDNIRELITDLVNGEFKSDIELSDPLPHFIQIVRTFLEIKDRIISDGLRYPHGRPK